MKKITNIRKSVCIMANELKKAGYTLSQAFKKAWRRVKLQMVVRVAGTTFENRQERLQFLKRFQIESLKVTLIKRRGKPIRPQCNSDHSPYSRDQQKNRDRVCAKRVGQRAVTGDRCRRESRSEAFRDHRRIQL